MKNLILVILSLSGLSVYADIIWSGDMNLQLDYAPTHSTPGAPSSDPSIFELDFNEDGIIDLLLNYSDGIQVTPANGSALVNHGEILAQEDVWGDFNLGPVVNSSLTWGNDAESLAYYSYSDAYGDVYTGPWVMARQGTLGLSFQAGGQTHYGWLRMSNQYGESVTVHDFAYESSPDTGIIAGAVPEPSSVALFTIGAIGAWILRKEKTANQRVHSIAGSARSE